MAKYKKQPRHNILSMRMSDKEMAVLTEMIQQNCKSTTMLMREALLLYVVSRDFLDNQKITV